MAKNKISIQDRRLLGFVHKQNVHEKDGKLFYLIQKGTNGDMDQYVGIGTNPDRIWNEVKGKYENAETLGLLPNIDDYAGAFPFELEQARDIILKSKDAKLEMVSLDEVKVIKKN